MTPTPLVLFVLFAQLSLLAFGGGRLRMGGARGQVSGDQQRQKQSWLGGKRSNQRRFPGVMAMISAEYRG